MPIPFELKWKTYNHIYHPYGDLIWHLFWGIVIGVSLFQAILRYDFWLLTITIIGLIFFFHPGFYQPRLMEIKITDQGVFIDKNFHPWEKFSSFEIFDNGFRKFIFLIPQKTSMEIHFPIEEFFVSENEVKEKLKEVLEETENRISLFSRIYRSIFL